VQANDKFAVFFVVWRLTLSSLDAAAVAVARDWLFLGAVDGLVSV